MPVLASVPLHRQVLAGRLHKIMPMIWMFSRKYYPLLSTHEQIGVSLQDLVQDGRIVAIHQAAANYNPKSEATFTTFAYQVLQNYYIDRVRASRADKRTALVYTMNHPATDKQGNRTTLENYITENMQAGRRGRLSNEDRIIQRIDAERAFVNAYRVADADLRKYMIRWLVQPHHTKIKEGIGFRAAKAEFRRLLVPMLTHEQCEIVLRDDVCKFNICRTVFDKFTTPRDAEKRPVPATFNDTREAELMPVLSPLRAAAIGRPLPPTLRRYNGSAPPCAGMRPVRKPIHR